MYTKAVFGTIRLSQGWNAAVGEVLTCKKEPRNSPQVCCDCKKDKMISGGLCYSRSRNRQESFSVGSSSPPSALKSSIKLSRTACTPGGRCKL